MSQSNNGHTLTFQCVVEADPEPQIGWTQSNTVIQDGGRYKMKKTAAANKYTVSLTIDKITPDDRGTYVVFAANSAGEAHATINLNFDSKFGSSHSKYVPHFYLPVYYHAVKFNFRLQFITLSM